MRTNTVYYNILYRTYMWTKIFQWSEDVRIHAVCDTITIVKHHIEYESLTQQTGVWLTLGCLWTFQHLSRSAVDAICLEDILSTNHEPVAQEPDTLCRWTQRTTFGGRKKSAKVVWANKLQNKKRGEKAREQLRQRRASLLFHVVCNIFIGRVQWT